MATYQTVTSEDRIDARPHLGRAKESLRAAETLRDGGFHADCATRSHQACVHAERALLATEKRSPQDIRGVHRMAALHFLAAGQLPSAHLAAVERLQILRERADDLPLRGVTAEDAADSVDLAAEFVAACEEWLARHGFLGSEDGGASS
ncbi:MAG: hypothetical protein HMLKMBBP_03952 [Planctomycetes bacterium]|nr:hypothetical protein [Planctomycetota bacterium]